MHAQNYLHVYIYIYTCMDGCMDVWMYGFMDVWMYGCMDVWMDGWMHVCMHASSTKDGQVVVPHRWRGSYHPGAILLPAGRMPLPPVREN